VIAQQQTSSGGEINWGEFTRVHVNTTAADSFRNCDLVIADDKAEFEFLQQKKKISLHIKHVILDCLKKIS
jgi:hypothetical protein